MNRTKAFRRFEKAKRIKKAFNIIRVWFTHGETEEEILEHAKKQADNMKKNKCHCCCNPRRSKLFKDKRTIQEKKAPDINDET